MEERTTFIYTYCAKENAEVQAIRKKYLPEEEDKLEQLKRLDDTVQSSGIMEALIVGIGGAIIFVFGMCLSMHIIGSGLIASAAGILLGLMGIAGMVAAYPVHRKIFNRTKKQLAPRILELSDEINKTQTFQK